jgi:hypothetical protein
MLVNGARRDFFGAVLAHPALFRAVPDVFVLAFVLAAPCAWHAPSEAHRVPAACMAAHARQKLK